MNKSNIKKINLKNKFDKVSKYWSPKIIAELNDYQFKLAKFKNDFIRHQHNDTDEAFIVIEGEIYIEFDDGIEIIKAGEMIIVPKGVAHKPSSKKEAKARHKPLRKKSSCAFSTANWISIKSPTR